MISHSEYQSIRNTIRELRVRAIEANHTLRRLEEKLDAAELRNSSPFSESPRDLGAAAVQPYPPFRWPTPSADPTAPRAERFPVDPCCPAPPTPSPMAGMTAGQELRSAFSEELRTGQFNPLSVLGRGPEAKTEVDAFYQRVAERLGLSTPATA